MQSLQTTMLHHPENVCKMSGVSAKSVCGVKPDEAAVANLTAIALHSQDVARGWHFQQAELHIPKITLALLKHALESEEIEKTSSCPSDISIHLSSSPAGHQGAFSLNLCPLGALSHRSEQLCLQQPHPPDSCSVQQLAVPPGPQHAC